MTPQICRGTWEEQEEEERKEVQEEEEGSCGQTVTPKPEIQAKMNEESSQTVPPTRHYGAEHSCIFHLKSWTAEMTGFVVTVCKMYIESDFF